MSRIPGTAGVVEAESWLRAGLDNDAFISISGTHTVLLTSWVSHTWQKKGGLLG